MSDELDRRVRAWQDHVRLDLKLQQSARLDAYVDNAPYRAIVALGKPALPGLIAHLRRGEVFLNRAVLAIAGLHREELLPDGGPSSEQELARRLVAWWDSTHASNL